MQHFISIEAPTHTHLQENFRESMNCLATLEDLHNL
jgi:hypothetical protein